jgi:hypothetical protein
MEVFFIERAKVLSGRKCAEAHLIKGAKEIQGLVILQIMIKK